jgi:hypothetical protein
MVIREILSCLFGAKGGRDGVWDFLGKRAAGKDRVALEQERNLGTERSMALIRPGMIIREGGPDFWREITMLPNEPGVIVAPMTSPPEEGARAIPHPPAPAEVEASPDLRVAGGGETS